MNTAYEKLGVFYIGREVDLDYRGLGDAGTWLIGRLQTERDKARVSEGLTSACLSAPRSH